MKLPTSNKTALFGKKPYVKKAYYPAQLLKVEPYVDKQGNLVEGKYGHQLIFEFAIYEKDASDTPIRPMMFKEEDKDEVPVRLSKFVYHEYKAKNPQPGEPLFQTAITPNSAITGTLVALGWKFSEEDVDLDPLIRNWVEVNVDDFKTKSKDGVEYTASTIVKVNPYNGGEIPKELEDIKASEKPKKIEKQLNHEAVEKKKVSDQDTPQDQGEISKLEDKIEKLKSLHKDGLISDGGLKQGIEQVETEIAELKKK